MAEGQSMTTAEVVAKTLLDSACRRASRLTVPQIVFAIRAAPLAFRWIVS